MAQTWLYLGQTPPGVQAERFPPENLLATTEWNWHSSPVFSPDGTEMFFVKFYNSSQRLELQYLRVENGVWSEPEIPSFGNIDFSENSPVYSSSGDTIYFFSERSEERIYFATRNEEQWSEPEPLNIPFPESAFIGYQFCITNNKTVYFEIWEEGQVDIYKSSFVNGYYDAVEKLPNNINTENFEWGPYVDGENSFIIFSSNRPGGQGFNDLYLSQKDGEENWQDPIALSSSINSSFEESYPHISFDDDYFFFTTQKVVDLGYNPYWVDSQIIYDLLTDNRESSEKDIPSDFDLNQNYPNPFNPSTTISFQIPKQSFVTLKIFDLLGNEITTLVKEEKQAGFHEVNFELGNYSSGIYFYQLKTSGILQTKKMMLLK